MEALICHKDNFIRFPDDPLDVTLAMRRSESLAGFPNVVGAIDGSHIAIKAPHVHHEDYFNRKQNYSINLQGVVDATGKFIDVSIGWPGSIHDARVLRLSTLYQRAENNLNLTEPVKRINGVTVRPLLISDSAYPLLPWLVSPYVSNVLVYSQISPNVQSPYGHGPQKYNTVAQSEAHSENSQSTRSLFT